MGFGVVVAAVLAAARRDDRAGAAMSSSVRRHRRERARRRRGVMTECHTCGREGPRRSMVTRHDQLVCRKTVTCMDRVLRPPPPPPAKWGYTIADIAALRGPLTKIPAEFLPLGYLSEDGIQQHG